ncbi:MAG: hypothetical protein ACOYNC_07260 [Bacteroidales bacterium]
MKKISVVLCFLFTVSIRMAVAQTAQVPLPGITHETETGYVYLVKPLLPEAVPAETAIRSGDNGMLTITSSPNPFTSHTLISCNLPEKGKMTLGITNMFGEVVKTFDENIMQAGTQVTDITAENLQPGIYTALLVFRTSDQVLMKVLRIVYTR